MRNETLRITNHSGFQIRFENGYLVSVQFGPCNYCSRKIGINDKRPFDVAYHEPNMSAIWESATAEVAVLDGNGDFVSLEKFYDGDDLSLDGTTIAGWVRPNQIGTIISNVMKYEEV
jgi:hypothetical protein